MDEKRNLLSDLESKHAETNRADNRADHYWKVNPKLNGFTVADVDYLFAAANAVSKLVKALRIAESGRRRAISNLTLLSGSLAAKGLDGDVGHVAGIQSILHESLAAIRRELEE